MTHDEMEREAIRQIRELQEVHRLQLAPLFKHLISIRSVRPRVVINSDGFVEQKIFVPIAIREPSDSTSTEASEQITEKP